MRTGLWTVRFWRQGYRLDLHASESEQSRQSGLHRVIGKGKPLVATFMLIGGGFQIAVEHPRNAIFFEVWLAGDHVGPNLIRFEKRTQPVIIILSHWVE